MIYKITKKLCQIFSYPIFWREFHHPESATQIKLNQTIDDNEITSPQMAQIEWVECDDVYKPIAKPIQQFLNERRIEADKFIQVYILETAHTALVEHLREDTRVEHGGILFGNAYTDDEYGIYVEITAAVAAPATIPIINKVIFLMRQQ
ncbi:hypothetical protein PN483_06035 [Nodularia spumigena CS-591/04]|uniref:hypothetical protein n=1 Tax=Nodularia spumigena TaxID=70799 RepID=UPI00232EF49D|nr:hypothetical protein [Nodularia spumigena]MDB9322752.1 hypothetical protein [Nodularia spumigena CS-591/07A]MDB9330051.1 hypothetical protein [Nodularia spumigena CS-591/04]MDB9360662.1 hypothetical protein [Nodularia spumigena CS-588/02]MDB9365378.1 hypothetical protein [Nodularia spumigena CS-588/02A10]